MLWQAIKLAVLCVKIIDVGLDAHRLARNPRDEFARAKLAPILVEMIAQPAVQRAELSHCDLARNAGMSFDGGSIELHAENVANGVALNPATDSANAIPMHILETPVRSSAASDV